MPVSYVFHIAPLICSNPWISVLCVPQRAILETLITQYDIDVYKRQLKLLTDLKTVSDMEETTARTTVLISQRVLCTKTAN